MIISFRHIREICPDIFEQRRIQAGDIILVGDSDQKELFIEMCARHDIAAPARIYIINSGTPDHIVEFIHRAEASYMNMMRWKPEGWEGPYIPAMWSEQKSDILQLMTPMICGWEQTGKKGYVVYPSVAYAEPWAEEEEELWR